MTITMGAGEKITEDWSIIISINDRRSTVLLRVSNRRLLRQIGRYIITHQTYGCNLTVEKGDEHIKLCLSSQTQKFIRYYTFKVVVRRKKQSMKTESPTFAEQRETICHGEKESRDGVAYWPLTEPSIKRCTCVNKQKNGEAGASGRGCRNTTLTCGRG